jgi:hypothetical protein
LPIVASQSLVLAAAVAAAHENVINLVIWQLCAIHYSRAGSL